VGGAEREGVCFKKRERKKECEREWEGKSVTEFDLLSIGDKILCKHPWRVYPSLVCSKFLSVCTWKKNNNSTSEDFIAVFQPLDETICAKE